MGILEGFVQGLGEVADQFYSEGLDQIRHQVVEQAYFGQQTTGSIELPQVEAPTIEAPAVSNGNSIDLASPTSDLSWGVAPATIIDSPSYSMEADASGRIVEPAIEPVTWQQAAQDIEAPQIEAPQQTQEMER